MKIFSKETGLFILDVFVNAIVIIALVLIIRIYIVSPFQIHGPSMCSTFNDFDGNCIRGNGEYIMIYKLGYQNIAGWQIGLPQRGDVVVFHPPGNEAKEFFIKRVVGLPGETVEIKQGHVYIDGEKLDESAYLNSANLGHTEPQSSQTIFEVPENHYFVLGDNRRASSDSRRCFEQLGCNENNTAYITLDEIQGKAFVVMWPLDRMRIVKYDELFNRGS